MEVIDINFLRTNGWRQGAIIDDKSKIEKLIEGSCGYRPSDSPIPEILVVISQDCDLLHANVENEPYIDFIAGCFDKEKDGNYFYGKNPRKLQISHNTGIIGLNIHDIVRITKDEFEKNNPKRASLTLNKNDVKQIVNWVSKRYSRAAFPDEFMNRLKKSSRPIEKLSKNRLMEFVYFIYIDIADEELNIDQNYDVILVIGVQRYLDQETKSEIDELFDDTFNTPGIEAEIRVVDLYDVTYEIMENYKRFDLDYRSFSVDYDVATPISGIDVV